jgi:hypothetical protein
MLLLTLKSAWVLVTFFLVFLLFPTLIFSRRFNRATLLGFAGNWVRMSLLTVIVILVLSKLRMLTAISVGFLLAIGFVLTWLHRRDWEFGTLTDSLERTVLRVFRKLENGFLGRDFFRRVPSASSSALMLWQPADGWSLALERRGLAAVYVFAVVTLMTVLRFANAWHELRLQQVEQYTYLLRARELLLNLPQSGRPFVFPTMISTTSLLSAADPMQVTRFLSALMGIFLVFAMALFLQRCMRVSLASAAAMYCLGAAAFPPVVEQSAPATSLVQKLFELFALSSPAQARSSTEFDLGLMFALLGLAFLAEWSLSPNRALLLDAASCVLLTALVSTFLLEIMAITAVILLLRPRLAPAALVLLCYGLAVYAQLSSSADIANEVLQTLPVAAAIAVGLVLATVALVVPPDLRRRGQPFALVACLLVAIIWLRPHQLISQPLEYEAAARQTEEIAHNFPVQKWVVVAPVEQFPETLGFGGYEDLAAFVEKYQTKVSASEFHFPGISEDLFIYVETRPFQVFSQEPLTVPFAVLADSTYRSYRSPAGRASLESDALHLCENYRQHHSDMQVYFQDDHLRIYRVHQEVVLNAEVGGGGTE